MKVVHWYLNLGEVKKNKDMIFRRILTTAAVSVFACGMASANSITQTQTFPATGTDVNDTQTDMVFENFQSAPGYVSGDILTSVTFSWNISQSLTTLSFAAPATLAGSQTFTYAQGTEVDANDGEITLNGIFSTDFANLIGAANTPNGTTNYNLYTVGGGTGACHNSSQSITGGETLNFLPGPSSNSGGGPAPTTCVSGNGLYSYVSGVVTSVDPSFYAGTGDYDLSYDTTGEQTASGSTSNLVTTVRGTSSDTLTVVYNYTLSSGTPEPTTMALFGGALIGIGLLRKRLTRG
jgi:hypothetical protein